MILKRGQSSVEIKGGIGLVDAIFVAERDPRKHPSEPVIRISQLTHDEMMVRRDQWKSTTGGRLAVLYPTHCAIDERRGRVLLWPPARKGNWFKAHYYPPMKETP